MTDAAGRITCIHMTAEMAANCRTCNPIQVSIRADLARPMTAAEAARRLIDEINRPATHEEKPDWRYLSRLDMTSLRALSEGG